MKVLDAEGAILGRLSSYAAKNILKGEDVIIINAEKAVISGKPKIIKGDFEEKRQRGSRFHGPFYPRYPDRIIRRSIRGMVPYKKTKGKEAMKRLKVYIGSPENYDNIEKMKKTEESLRCKFIRLVDICRHMGAKI